LPEKGFKKGEPQKREKACRRERKKKQQDFTDALFRGDGKIDPLKPKVAKRDQTFRLELNAGGTCAQKEKVQVINEMRWEREPPERGETKRGKELNQFRVGGRWRVSEKAKENQSRSVGATPGKEQM